MRKALICSPQWCSLGEPGNEASHGIVYSAMVLTRGAWNEASPRIVLRTGAHQGSLGTRLAQGLYTPHWCSPGEPGMRLAQGLYSILALIVLIRRTSNSLNASTTHLPVLSDRNDIIGMSPTHPQFKYKCIVSIHGASKLGVSLHRMTLPGLIAS